MAPRLCCASESRGVAASPLRAHTPSAGQGGTRRSSPGSWRGGRRISAPPRPAWDPHQPESFTCTLQVEKFLAALDLEPKTVRPSPRHLSWCEGGGGGVTALLTLGVSHSPFKLWGPLFQMINSGGTLRDHTSGKGCIDFNHLAFTHSVFSLMLGASFRCQPTRCSGPLRGYRIVTASQRRPGVGMARNPTPHWLP